MALVHISDDEKLAVVEHAVPIILANEHTNLRAALVDAGTVYGQLRQGGRAHNDALALIIAVVQGWYNGTRVNPPVKHIGDDDKIAVADGAARIPDSDRGGLVDIGTQYGQRIEAGYSRERALREAGDWLVHWYGGDHPWPPVATEHPSPLVGRLRLDGRVFLDDTGPVLPLFCHFGEAFSAYVRRPDDVLRQLDAIAAAGYHGIRFWDVLGYYDAGWAGREVTPFAFHNRSGGLVAATTDYYPRLQEFLLACNGRRLAVMHDRGDLNTWSHGMKLEHLGQVGAVYRELGELGRHVLAGLWAVNEGWQNGVTDPRLAGRMLDAFRESAGWWPDVRGLSAPAEGEELEPLRTWSQDPATVVTIHPLRDPGNRKRMLEHHFSNGLGCRLIGKPGWATEPIGPGQDVTVGQENDPEMLALLAAISIIAGQAWTYMSGFGVFWNGAIESQPGFHEVPQLVAKLPRDLHTYEHVHHSGTRWRGTRVFAIADDNDHDRADGAQAADGRFVYVLYSDRGVPSLPIERQARMDVLHGGRIANIVIGQTI
jgi:hypothetical protein